MIKTDGYFLLHRSLFENPTVTKDADYFITWIYILSQAEWKSGKKVEFGGRIIELQAGQFTTGVSNQMLSDLKKVNKGLNVSKLNRIIKRLKNEKQIEQRTDHQCSLITVLNWEKYQVCEQRNEQQVNNDRKTSEQRVNTNELKEEYKEGNKEELSKDNSNSQTIHHKRIVDKWNTLKDYGVPPIRSITPNSNRERDLKARLKEFGDDSFDEIIEHFKVSKFLQGKATSFKPEFGWAAKKSWYAAILEGKYDDERHDQKKQVEFDEEEFLRGLAE